MIPCWVGTHKNERPSSGDRDKDLKFSRDWRWRQVAKCYYVAKHSLVDVVIPARAARCFCAPPPYRFARDGGDGIGEDPPGDGSAAMCTAPAQPWCQPPAGPQPSWPPEPLTLLLRPCHDGLCRIAVRPPHARGARSRAGDDRRGRNGAHRRRDSRRRWDRE